MENKKYILGLDVSTSTIGICLFEDLGEEGKLCYLTHFEPRITPKPETQLENLIEKANLCFEKIIEDFNSDKFNITKIIVEKPLMNSKNQKTAKILEMFNEYLSYKLSCHYGLDIDFITVDNARRYGLPELVGEKSRLMSNYPKKIAGLSRDKWSKFLIMYLVSQRYPEINWMLNNNLKINKKNFDRADSIVAVLGFMLRENIWIKMKSEEYWNNIDLSHEKCIEIISKNIAYEKFTKEYVDNNKELTPEEKKKIKKKYLKETFKINNFINVVF